MTRTIFLPEARTEIAEAREWYEEQRPGLGREFMGAVDSRLASILRHPHASPRIFQNFRKAMLRRFPYSIIYLPDETEVLIVSCFHHSRSPDAWQYRLDA